MDGLYLFADSCYVELIQIPICWTGSGSSEPGPDLIKSRGFSYNSRNNHNHQSFVLFWVLWTGYGFFKVNPDPMNLYPGNGSWDPDPCKSGGFPYCSSSWGVITIHQAFVRPCSELIITIWLSSRKPGRKGTLIWGCWFRKIGIVKVPEKHGHV